MGVWEELLEVRPIGIQDDFFALGGHSLLALRLLGAIERHFGRRLPLAALLEASTIEVLACLLRREAGPARRSPIVPIRSHGSRPPLFCVHPVGGNVLCYLPLARLARDGGLDGPLYGIQAPAVADLPARWTIESMAAHYIAALRQVQPAGPYLLAGWSLGGAVAYEMALQLAASEHGEVALLAMIEPAAPGAPGEGGGDEEATASELLRFVVDLRRLAGLDPLAIDAAGCRLPAAGALPPEVREEEVRELFLLFRANRRALTAYRPRPYGGRLLLLGAAETAASAAERLAGWDRLAARGAEVHLLPGNHYSLLTAPRVAALSQLLETSIRRALGGGAPAGGEPPAGRGRPAAPRGGGPR